MLLVIEPSSIHCLLDLTNTDRVIFLDVFNRIQPFASRLLNSSSKIIFLLMFFDVSTILGKVFSVFILVQVKMCRDMGHIMGHIYKSAGMCTKLGEYFRKLFFLYTLRITILF